MTLRERCEKIATSLETDGCDHSACENAICEACSERHEAARRIRAALAAPEPSRCNRCQSNLCEHDNCTDWTCARACSKCAKGPEPSETDVERARWILNESPAVSVDDGGFATDAAVSWLAAEFANLRAELTAEQDELIREAIEAGIQYGIDTESERDLLKRPTVESILAKAAQNG